MRRAMTMVRVVAVYLLAGLMASVAVAWGLAWGVGYSGTNGRSDAAWLDERTQGINLFLSEIDTRRLGARVKVHAQYAWGGVRRGHYYFSDTHNAPSSQLVLSDQSLMYVLNGPEWTDLKGGVVWSGENLGPESWGTLGSKRYERTDGAFVEWMDEARGLPLVCLWQEWEADSTGKIQPNGGIRIADRGGAPSFLPALAYRALPLRPIWAGLAFNTAFYAVVFWLAVRALKGMRGWRRFKRGLCPGCAYDLRFDYTRGCSECGRGVKGAMGSGS